ncbi:MAG: ABC transporter permease [Lachnospiraceae bacterium]|nr:ABC transporter permease [Lachnospiraceae bacterium]
MKQFRKMVYPYLLWSTVVIAVPMLLILLYAFTSGGNSVSKFMFSLHNFKRFLTDKTFLEVLYRSLRIAVETTVVCVLLGYPAAYIIAKYSEKVKMRWVLVITLPTWINMLVRTYAWTGILQEDGVINSFLGLFGIGPVTFMYTDFAVILGMVYNFLPFMIIQIYTSLTKMDYSLIEAASDLGANPRKCFTKVTLPLSMPGVISGITLVFLPSVSSFCIPRMLGGGSYVMVGTIIESQFLTAGDWNFGSAISLIMAIIIMISMYITKKVDKGEKLEAINA